MPRSRSPARTVATASANNAANARRGSGIRHDGLLSGPEDHLQDRSSANIKSRTGTPLKLFPAMKPPTSAQGLGALTARVGTRGSRSLVEGHERSAGVSTQHTALLPSSTGGPPTDAGAGQRQGPRAEGEVCLLRVGIASFLFWARRGYSFV